MKITIDLKSALCGLAIGVVAVLSIGAGTSSNPAGKYKIVTGISEGKGYAIMVDTQTGQAWGYNYDSSTMSLSGKDSFQCPRDNAIMFWKEK